MRNRWNIVLPVIALLAVVGLYRPSLHYPLFFDDIRLFHQNELNNLFIAGPKFDLRWLPYFLTAWVDLIFEDKVFAQRIFNVVLHLTTGYVLYHLIKQVSDRVAPHPNNSRAALVGAMFFLLHPLSVYAVGYLAQRTLMMATLFSLLTLNTYFDGLVTRKKAYFIFSALFYLFAAFSKEHAVLIPVVALALTPLAVPLNIDSMRQTIMPFLLYLPVATAVILKRLGVLGHGYEPLIEQLVVTRDPQESQMLLWLLSSMTQMALYFKYLLLALLPNPGWMSIDLRPPFAEHFLQPKYLLGVTALIGYGVTTFAWMRSGGRRALVGFALLAPLLLFAVELSTVRIQEPFVLYRTYLWIPFLTLLIPALTFGLSARLFWVTMLTLVTILTAASADRLHSFSSSYLLWDDAIKKLPHEFAPGSARAFSARCQQNMVMGRLDDALSDCTHALEVFPKYRPARQTRAYVYLKLKRYDAAISDAQMVVNLFPTDPHVYALLGSMYKGAGMLDKAISSFEIACERKSIAACLELGGSEANQMKGNK